VTAAPDSLYREVNVGGTEHILEAAGRHGVERTIHCSTVAVLGAIEELPCDEDRPVNSTDVYRKTKLDGELRARAAIAQGLPVVIVRPAGIYGPGDLRFLKLFRAIYQRRFRMFGSGESAWQGIYIDDLVDGLLLCAEHPKAHGQTYILAEERRFTLNQVVRAIATAVGAPTPKGHLPYWPLAAGAALCEALCRPLRIEPPLYLCRGAFIDDRAFSTGKARHELGYVAKMPLEEGLRRTAGWYLEHGHLAARVL
jgi:nucleoside-diphosphate-sugar epimerase